MPEFVAIDVETANADLSTICQIGIVGFSEGRVTEKWQSLVNPEDYFDGINISIHGITQDTVSNAPTFPEVHQQVLERVAGTVVLSHTTFDRSAINAAFSKHSIDIPELTWLDTARVVRRTWTERASSGYGLAEVAEFLGITFEHHNAEEDARAAGEIFLRAIRETGISVEEWLACVKRPIGASSVSSSRITREGDPEGPLFGEVVVFTGALTLPRREVADWAAAAGCTVGGGVTKSTTLLVVGDQDVKKLAGHEKSSKHRKAETLIATGQEIRILRESDFRSLIELLY